MPKLDTTKLRELITDALWFVDNLDYNLDLSAITENLEKAIMEADGLYFEEDE